MMSYTNSSRDLNRCQTIELNTSSIFIIVSGNYIGRRALNTFTLSSRTFWKTLATNASDEIFNFQWNLKAPNFKTKSKSLKMRSIN